MTQLPIYQIDAFAEALFGGNPAAVCPLQDWLPTATLQAIAAENNVSETAFFVPDQSGAADFELRWFTPEVEVPLCGHATLATGFALLTLLKFSRPKVVFKTQSGLLSVERRGNLFWLDLPATMPQPVPQMNAEVVRGLGLAPRELLVAAGKYFAVFDDADTVAKLAPDMAVLATLTGMGVIATAAATTSTFPDVDFVSRYFTPACGITEDPVTGSAHCLLVPYWAQRLGKTSLSALQISARRGRVQCELLGERVSLGGHAQLYLSGTINLP